MLTITSVVGGIGFFFLSIFVLIILGVVLRLLVEFFWRACAIEQVGVREAIRLGWNMVRKNLGSVALMWLVMFGVRLVWSIFVIVAFFILLPILALTIVAGADRSAGCPGCCSRGFPACSSAVTGPGSSAQSPGCRSLPWWLSHPSSSWAG